jgi:hypothetical protein
MKSKPRVQNGGGESMNAENICVSFFKLLVLPLTCFSAQPAKADAGPLIAPIHSVPAGQTYGRWAASWYQWALQIPAAENPVLDTTGQYCAQRQVDVVWFLAGVFGSGQSARTCNIPVGKALFFPLINNAYFAFLSDPPGQRTEEFVRNQAKCTEPAQINVSIDGFKVPQPQRFFTGPSGSQSPIFNVQLPPHSVFEFLGIPDSDIPELALSPSAEQGYYLFVNPLAPGNHTIRWVASGCTPGGFQEITYILQIGG